MTTFSPAQARANLSSLLKRAAKGEDIGILLRDQVIIALRPVTVHSDNYALQEYGLTDQELDRFVKRMDKRIARDRKAGKMTLFSGDIEADIADCPEGGHPCSSKTRRSASQIKLPRRARRASLPLRRKSRRDSDIPENNLAP